MTETEVLQNFRSEFTWISEGKGVVLSTHIRRHPEYAEGIVDLALEIVLERYLRMSIEEMFPGEAVCASWLAWRRAKMRNLRKAPPKTEVPEK